MSTDKTKRAHCDSPGCWAHVRQAPKRLPLAHAGREGWPPIDSAREEVARRVKENWIERRP